jgi:lipopolysaccharide export system protein LptA
LNALPKSGTDRMQLRRLQCDTVDFSFYPGSNRLQKLAGDGHVQVVYRSGETGTKGQTEEFRTSSASIRSTFRESDGGAETINQSGGFTYQDSTRTATSGACDFTAGTEKLVLSDHPNINETDYSATGEVIEYDRKGKILTVRRNVRSYLRSTAGKREGFMTASTDPASPAIITADEMQYWQEQDKASYGGNVNLLSADSQLQAQSLLILNKGNRVEAKGNVRHLILRTGNVTQAKPAKDVPPQHFRIDDKTKGSGPVRIRSAQLQYSQAANNIHYAGGVYLESDSAKIWSDDMDAFLDSEGKRIDRAIARGNLRITQAGREVKGDQGEYFLVDEKFVVTGNPVELKDTTNGRSSSGRRLTFYSADDRIVWDR